LQTQRSGNRQISPIGHRALTKGAITVNITIQDINDRINAGVADFIEKADAAYAAQLDRIAEHIFAHREQSPVVLLSGPSGSGKTTTAQMLERKLDAMGCETHTLSMDDYFRTLTPAQLALAEKGTFDLESPERVDTELLECQLERFIAGEPITIPHFDFRTSIRTDSERVLTRKAGELLILEGIHALNPAVVSLPEEQTVRLYVSVRTRLITKADIPLHPMEIRLLRRILRDIRTRGRDPRDTLRMFRGVQRGEDNYIMPYKHRSTFDIDTFFAYEASVYKSIIAPLLLPLADQPEIRELLPVLDELSPIDASAVPTNALIREFIGE
jgi:uridine kinase